MRNFASILLILTGISLSLYGQDSHALFIKNDGQWSSDFNYRLRLNSGDVFFEDNGYTSRSIMRMIFTITTMNPAPNPSRRNY
ncbi:MAG TPA: hypothetical protein DIU20_14230 [Cryomorphaceae bacterium]|nr:hypothetical protein [Cryomorphaceae bacterium]